VSFLYRLYITVKKYELVRTSHIRQTELVKNYFMNIYSGHFVNNICNSNYYDEQKIKECYKNALYV